jgi:hypothetical protein
MKSKYLITNKLTFTGFNFTVDHKKYGFEYLKGIWNKFPDKYKPDFASNLTFLFTHFLASKNLKPIEYQFPPPTLFYMFAYEFIYSLPAMNLEFSNTKFTGVDLLKQVHNSDYNYNFKGLPDAVDTIKPIPLDQKSVTMPFSFGKDSLLTYALCRELNYDVDPIFFLEPTTPVQNQNKIEIAKQFTLEFKQKIHFQPNGLGKIRESDGLMWGWDLLIFQYALLMIPYLYSHKSQYLFWSHEQSVNEYLTDLDGLKLNHFHEQSAPSMQRLNLMYRNFSLNTKSMSLLEPIQELVILRILHKRYPQIGKYQISCDSENATHTRWCGKCEECARVNIFMHAIGVNPTTIGLPDNLLKSSKVSLYKIFTENIPNDPQNLPVWMGERLLTFYIAYKRGITGDVMKLFKSTLLSYCETNRNYLFKTFLKIYQPQCVDSNLSQKIIKIYKSELKNFIKEII